MQSVTVCWPVGWKNAFRNAVTATERRLDDIGWAKNIRDAERLAKAGRRFFYHYLGGWLPAVAEAAPSR